MKTANTRGILVPRFTPPRHVSKSVLDGLPDYVVATKGSPYRFDPPPGFEFVVYHDDERLYEIVEADRVRGFAIGLHYEWQDDGRRKIVPKDEEGVSLHRLYDKGRITFRLVPR